MAFKKPASCPNCELMLDVCWKNPNTNAVICERAVVDDGSLSNNNVTMSLAELMPILLAILLLCCLAKVFSLVSKFLWSML